MTSAAVPQFDRGHYFCTIAILIIIDLPSSTTARPTLVIYFNHMQLLSTKQQQQLQPQPQQPHKNNPFAVCHNYNTHTHRVCV